MVNPSNLRRRNVFARVDFPRYRRRAIARCDEPSDSVRHRFGTAIERPMQRATRASRPGRAWKARRQLRERTHRSLFTSFARSVLWPCDRATTIRSASATVPVRARAVRRKRLPMRKGYFDSPSIEDIPSSTNPKETLMTEPKQPACRCQSCAGAACTCGCQQPSDQKACNCGAASKCGPACACSKS